MGLKDNKFLINLNKLTKRGDIDWIFIDEYDPFYDHEKEQFTSNYKITDNKSLDFLLTKHYFPRGNYYNYYLTVFFRKNNINTKIQTYYYQTSTELFQLFGNVKYKKLLEYDIYNSYFIHELYENWNNYKWQKTDNFYRAVLEEKTEGKETEYVKIIVTKRMISIYYQVNNETPDFLNEQNDKILYRILYENVI